MNAVKKISESSRSSCRRQRKSKLSEHSKRLTPVEVVSHWFRRGKDFVAKIHLEFPDFPAPAPDGLYLLSAVAAWFARFHGINSAVGAYESLEHEKNEALRAARGH